MSKHIVALSGGKDSTALALRLAEVAPREYTYICSPTGDELPDMVAHWEKLERLLGTNLTYLRAHADLNGLIDQFNALPNWRMRWCTRILKIETARYYYAQNPGSTVYVGLRADEEGRIGGIFGDDVTQRYPLREWGWGIERVMEYLDERGVEIPRRTDCARCFFQTLDEWRVLWSEYPEIYAHAEEQERRIQHTFRSPSRDTWPASLEGLRLEFESGRTPPVRRRRDGTCRMCSM